MQLVLAGVLQLTYLLGMPQLHFVKLPFFQIIIASLISRAVQLSILVIALFLIFDHLRVDVLEQFVQLEHWSLLPLRNSELHINK